jgi:DNA recombination protein RmuC
MSITPELLTLAGIALLLGAVCVALVLRRPEDLSATVAALQERVSARETELAVQARRTATLEAQIAGLQESIASHRAQAAQLQTLLEQERRQAAEKLALLNDAREQMTLQFKFLATEILEDKSRRFTASNKESIGEILRPLTERIQHFEKKVEETYDKEARERFSLASEIRNLQTLNARISEDAVNLTNALKGESKTQGTWGEVILESILEKSGLVKGREYQTQVSLKSLDGARAQPDVIVRLPENKQIIIDAKVSLKAYEAFCSEQDVDKRSALLQQHVQSLRQHVKSLGSKDYQNLHSLNSLDFVLLFMPVEAAFSVAVQEDAELFSQAFDQNIILVGPSTLLATLRTIQNIWRYEQQNQNAIEIATAAGALYDKFVAFTADLEDIGQRIDASRKSYDKAHNKLMSGKGNLVARIEVLKKLGARASKKHAAQLLARSGVDEIDALQAASEKEDK